MKKTIIALLALGSAAMGVTLEDAILSMKGDSVAATTAFTATSTPATFDGDFSLVLTLDIDAVQTFVSDSVKNQAYTLACVSAADERKAGICLVNSKDLGDLLPGSTSERVGFTTVASTTDSVSTSIGTPGWTRGHVDDTGIVWEDVIAVSVAMVHDAGASTTNYLTVLDNQGNTKVYSANNTSLKWSGIENNAGFDGISGLSISTDYVTSAYLFKSALSESEAKSITTALVPEPTTATLSLLALAGLAARRRRR